MPPVDGDPALIVFLRYPERGKVKTRIAAELGEDSALYIYQELVSITLDTVSQLNQPVYLYYYPTLPPELQRDDQFHYRTQCPGDLGSKMLDALTNVLAQHRSAIIIGSDCPALTPEILQQSFDALEHTDIVMGPAEDGGYYLLGCHHPHPALFDHMPWGGSAVFAETLKRARQQKLRESILQTLYDIDTARDWHRYKTESTGKP